MRQCAPLALVISLWALMASATAGHAEHLVVSLSTHRVLINSSFTGAELVLFGSVERDGRTVSRRGGYDIVVTVKGPPETAVTRRKDRVLGIWVNVESRTFADAPTYLAVLANRPVAEIAPPDVLRRLHIGLADALLPQVVPAEIAEIGPGDPFRAAFVRLNTERGLYLEEENGVSFLTPNLFHASIQLPASVPIGSYEVDAKLFADGALLSRQSSTIEVVRVGFEQFVAGAARDHGTMYGFATAILALLTGWLASVVFRRD